MPESSLCRRILIEQYERSVQSRVGTCLLRFFGALSSVQYTFAPTSTNFPSVDIPALRILVKTSAQSSFTTAHECPRSCPSAGASLCTYARWFWRGSWEPNMCSASVSVLDISLPYKKVVQFLRFRCGCHNLPNLQGRRLRLPRYLRHCPQCSSSLCDEQHMIFECPALAPLRNQFHHLFLENMTVRQFMWQRDLHGVALFVCAALDYFQ